MIDEDVSKASAALVSFLQTFTRLMAQALQQQLGTQLALRVEERLKTRQTQKLLSPDSGDHIETRKALLGTPLITAEEVAALLKVSPKSIYRWAKDALLPSFREGRLVRFLESDVEAFIRDRMRATHGLD